MTAKVGAGETAIHLDGVVCTLGDKVALDIDRLTIAPGERVAIVGQNGAGKSTLLRLLSGFARPERGTITVLGQRLPTRAAPRPLTGLRREIGQVFQGLHLVQRLSALDNVLIGALGRLTGWRTWLRCHRAADIAEAETALREVGLLAKAEVRVDRLSGGERQKVAIARMLMQRARLILADEPTAALDPQAAAEVCALLARAAHGETLVSVVHNPTLLPLLADRVIGLRQGQIVFDLPVAAGGRRPPAGALPRRSGRRAAARAGRTRLFLPAGAGNGHHMSADPGRSCPVRYRYGAGHYRVASEQSAATLYVIGGLYGNPPALETIKALAAQEPGPVTLCFNGDFNWFNVDDGDFDAINRSVLEHDACLGNVEAELLTPDDTAGCGCAYPDSVDADVVARSNAIHARLKVTAQRHSELLAQLRSLPMVRRYRVGDGVVGVVHGDAESLAGWRFDVTALDDDGNREWLKSVFKQAECRCFREHPYLPAGLALYRSGRWARWASRYRHQ